MATPEYEQWLTRGRAHQQEGRAIDAMLCFRRAARLNPRASNAQFALGEVLWQLGRIPDAVAAWREASRVAPRHAPPLQAEAEALLALGDLPGAAAVARRVQELLPDEPRSALIRGIGALASGERISDRTAADVVADVLTRAPELLAQLTISGPLAAALDLNSDARGRDALLSRIARMPGTLANASPYLVALALESVAAGVTDDDRAVASKLAGIACTRGYAAADHEPLRRAAIAVARIDAAAARVLAGVYASLCVANFPSPVPLVWPRRTAGARLRVVVLVADVAAGVAVLEAIEPFAAVECDILLAGLGASTAPEFRGLPGLVLPATSDAAPARVIAARDPDVLVDLAGLSAATGPLLARRPARAIFTVATLPLPNAAPLVDLVSADAEALVATIVQTQRAHERHLDCPLDVRSMAARWDEAVRTHEAGDRDVALALYEDVLRLQPGFAPALHLTGVARRDKGDAAGAMTAFEQSLNAAPRNVDTRIAAVRAALAMERHAEAIALCEQGLALAPGNAALLRALGQVRLSAHDGASAAAAFAEALRADALDGETHYHHGVALQMAREGAEAARAYQRALTFRPDLTAAHFNLGVLFQEQGAVDAAVAAYEEVLAGDSGNVAAWKNLGQTLYGAVRLDAFIEHFRRFEARHPNALPLAVQALEALQMAGDFAGVERYLAGISTRVFVAQGDAELVDALEELLYLLLFFDVPPETMLTLAHEYDAAMRRIHGEPPPPADRRPGRLRIGYLSADLRDHVMGKMMWAAVRHHDKLRFEIFFYSTSAQADAWTEEFRALGDHFEDVSALSDRAAVQRIADDDLDLLVDLSTHTKGARPAILARKPARVQLTHVASAGTVGLSAIDFKLTDRYADVPGNQEFQLETLLPMDGCVLPFRTITPASVHPFHREGLGIAAGTIVMGAFVTPLKLSRRCLAQWREVLQRIPRAKIAFSPTNEALRPAYERICAAAGIAPDRIFFLAQGQDDAQNQARYALVDFVLDPMPFGGVNGTMEALQAGVPVVTLTGKRHGERTSYSILANLGVTDTVAQSGREYVDIATRLADDPAFMRDVRAWILAGIERSPLTDMPSHTRALERAYVAAIEGRAPGALADAMRDRNG